MPSPSSRAASGSTVRPTPKKASRRSHRHAFSTWGTLCNTPSEPSKLRRYAVSGKIRKTSYLGMVCFCQSEVGKCSWDDPLVPRLVSVRVLASRSFGSELLSSPNDGLAVRRNVDVG